jgi:hypothetical protein
MNEKMREKNAKLKFCGNFEKIPLNEPLSCFYVIPLFFATDNYAL